MKQSSLPETVSKLADRLHHFRLKRRKRRTKIKKIGSMVRGYLTQMDRDTILRKTGGRCHICGGKIGGAWQADHVMAHSVGGKHAVENYLPAHKLCNHYRWYYFAEEFQYILKIGVWTRTQIERKSSIGLEVAKRFLSYEWVREARRKRG